MKLHSINNKYNYNQKMKVNKLNPKLYITSIGLLTVSMFLNTSNMQQVNAKNSLNETKYDKIQDLEYEEGKELEQEEPKKLVALTFDDGPGKYTSDLVEILDENDATATFFILGSNIEKYSDAVVAAYTSGNEIGFHSYSHTSFKKMSIEEIKEELDQTKVLLDELDVDYSNLVRPPYGAINDNIKDNVDATFILWNVDTEDWKSRDKETIKQEVRENIKDGSIILFHDIYSSTVDAIKEILPELSDEYKFVTVSEMFEEKNKVAENEKQLKINEKYFQY